MMQIRKEISCTANYANVCSRICINLYKTTAIDWYLVKKYLELYKGEYLQMRSGQQLKKNQ